MSCYNGMWLVSETAIKQAFCQYAMHSRMYDGYNKNAHPPKPYLHIPNLESVFRTPNIQYVQYIYTYNMTDKICWA